jgi:hypothetical protein
MAVIAFEALAIVGLVNDETADCLAKALRV